MSSKELDRLAVVRQVVEGRLTQAKTGEIIGLSERQVRRLCAAFEELGPAGSHPDKRGQPSNRRLPDELGSQVEFSVREARIWHEGRFRAVGSKRVQPGMR